MNNKKYVNIVNDLIDDMINDGMSPETISWIMTRSVTKKCDIYYRLNVALIHTRNDEPSDEPTGDSEHDPYTHLTVEELDLQLEEYMSHNISCICLQSTNDCPICCDGNAEYKLKCCDNWYHQKCLSKWYGNDNNTCPTCRHELVVSEDITNPNNILIVSKDLYKPVSIDNDIETYSPIDRGFQETYNDDSPDIDIETYAPVDRGFQERIAREGRRVIQEEARARAIEQQAERIVREIQQEGRREIQQAERIVREIQQEGRREIQQAERIVRAIQQEERRVRAMQQEERREGRIAIGNDNNVLTRWERIARTRPRQAPTVSEVHALRRQRRQEERRQEERRQEESREDLDDMMTGLEEVTENRSQNSTEDNPNSNGHVHEFGDLYNCYIEDCNYSRQCRYFYQRGTNIGNRCLSTVVDANSPENGLQLYCKYCLRKNTVRRQLGTSNTYSRYL